MDQLAHKKEFYKKLILFFIASMMLFMDSLGGIFIFDSFFAFFAFFVPYFVFLFLGVA